MWQYLKVLKKNKRPFLRTLHNIVIDDVKSLTGSNVRRILLDTGLDPRSTSKHQLADWAVYQAADTWTVPLLASLLELRNETWVVNFDLEDEMDTLDDKDINFMIEAVCTG